MAINGTEPLKVNLPFSHYKRLTVLAKNREVSIATLVNEAVKEWLERHHK